MSGWLGSLGRLVVHYEHLLQSLPDVPLYRVLHGRLAVGRAMASGLPTVLQRFPEVRLGGRPMSSTVQR